MMNLCSNVRRSTFPPKELFQRTTAPQQDECERKKLLLRLFLVMSVVPFLSIIHEFSNVLLLVEEMKKIEESAAGPMTLFQEDLFSKHDGTQKGILTNKSRSFFKVIQDEIDNYNLTERCQRYEFGMEAKPGQPQQPNRRRIFFGALIADEPWETIDIISTEAFGVFLGVVFVESNRTQMFYPRTLKWANKPAKTAQLKKMFGVEQLQVREYVNEDSEFLYLDREHDQRKEIVKGWKELGMTKEDIGYIADTDEFFSRDLLRAVQHCPYIDFFDYDKHKCTGEVKMMGLTRVYEGSPECVTRNRNWFHPDMVIGACVEEIGNETVHPRSAGEEGSGHNGDIENTVFPALHSAEDFRKRPCGRFVTMNQNNRHMW